MLLPILGLIATEEAAYDAAHLAEEDGITIYPFGKSFTDAPSDVTARVTDNKTPRPHQLSGEDIYAQRELYIDNLIGKEAITVSNPQKEDEESVMRLPKNVRRNKYNKRYEWRKTICGAAHYLGHMDLKVLVKMIKEHMRYIKEKIGRGTVQTQNNRKLINLCWAFFRRHKEGKIKSDGNYKGVLKLYLSKLNKPIEHYTKNDIIDFLDDIESKTQARLCYFLLTGVFNDEAGEGTIKRNVMTTIDAPIVKSIKGDWYNIAEQKLIYNNRHKCSIGDEIEFFILIGCRLDEAFNTTINFETRNAFVDGTKSDCASRYVEISTTYISYLKTHWATMFKKHYDYYTAEFNRLLDMLKIKKLLHQKPIHRLRHTFATNTYYLGVNDKKRSYLLGHASTKITNDIYTNFDPGVKKSDVLSIYGKLYPKY
jgi:integrase